MKDEETAGQRGRAYHFPEGVKGELYRIPGGGLTLAQRRAALDDTRDYMNAHRDDFLGYQSRAKLDDDGLLHAYPFLGTAINNIGDSFANPKMTEPGDVSPLADGYFSLNFKWVERAVLDYFAERWHAGAPRRVEQDQDPEWLKSYWGYVLSMGCTEGNLMGIRSARDYLEGCRLQYNPRALPADCLTYQRCQDANEPAFQPVLLMSEASHYSVAKLAQMLKVERRLVELDAHGRMRLGALIVEAEKVLKAGRPLAVIFNYGTTWTGALDDVEAAVPPLLTLLGKYRMDWRRVVHDGQVTWRHGYWFHVDGALGAGYATYTDGLPGERLPRFDFALGVQSIAMSGHKWPGAPWPTGIYMTRNQYMLTNQVPDYVASLDSTLAGSRSGLAPLYLWDWAARDGDAAKKARADAQLALARRAQAMIREAWDPEATRAPGSVMVIFKRPSTALVRRFALASVTTEDERRFSHIVCMPHVDEALITRLVEALKAEKAEGLAADAADPRVVDDGRGGW